MLVQQFSIFPIFFFDGKYASEVGTIRLILSYVCFKKIESVIRRKIRVPRLPIAIFFYFCSSSAEGLLRRVPVDKNSNFAAIASEKAGYFYVELNISRRRDIIPDNSRQNLETQRLKLLQRENRLIESYLSSRSRREQQQQPTRNVGGGCDECRMKEGVITFHHCINDRIVIGLKSP
ncbi:hypothetical protein ACLOJK_006022 [Asimina triloba]